MWHSRSVPPTEAPAPPSTVIEPEVQAAALAQLRRIHRAGADELLRLDRCRFSPEYRLARLHLAVMF